MKYTDQEIIKAIIEASGCVSDAANILGCERSTIYRRMSSNPSIAATLEGMKEAIYKRFKATGLDTAMDPSHPQYFQFHRYYGRVMFGINEQQIDHTSKGDKIEGFKVILPGEGDD